MQILALTKAQQRVWLEWKLQPHSTAYNNPLLYRLEGNVDVDKLAQALQNVVDTQPALRCYFIEQGGLPKQILERKVIVNLAYHDVRHALNENGDALIRTLIAENVELGFQLNQIPLFRFSLIRVAETQYLLVLNIHHIVVDGYSANLLIEKISNYYNQEIDNHESFDDIYVNYINQSLSNPTNCGEFWMQQLQDTQYFVDLYSNSIQTSINPDIGHRQHFNIPIDLTKKIKQLAKKNRTTDFLVLMSAFYIVLAKYANQYDLTLGYAIDTRPLECKKLFGFFVNNIPLRLVFSPDYSFQNVVAKLTQLRKLIKPNQNMDYADIVRCVRQCYPDLPNTLYNISFIRANFALSGLNLHNVNVQSQPIFTGAVKDDLCLLYDESETFEFEIEYRLHKYSSQYIELIQQSYILCLQAIIDNPECKIADMSIFANNDTLTLPLVEHVNNDTLITRFISQVKCNPDKIAINTIDSSITYQTLYQQVENLITYFVSRNLSQDHPVVVYLERTPYLLSSLLALQWLGIPYIPLDINTPHQRLSAIMEESKAQCIITDTELSFQTFETLSLSNKDNISGLIPPPVIGNLAYIIYTSGSTGKPKGVAISPLALNNFLTSMAEKFLTSEDEMLLAITTIAFDISGLELFLPLWAGKTIYLANQKQHKDPFAIKNILDNYPITLMQATPAMWKMLIDIGWEGKPDLVALCGGEALTPALADQLYTNSDELWNMYGPTEATIWCAMKKISAHEPISIGKAIRNIQLYVMDQNMTPLPSYIKGELYIGGLGLAQGYLNRDDLTSSHFFYHSHLDTRLYRTGDVASINENGDIIHFGRKDNQIKLNGYRIELGEIEAQLSAIPIVKQAAVVVHQNQLIAYLAVSATVTSDQIQNNLSRTLPDYMLPKRYIFMESLPISNSGKIDRKALPIDAIPINQTLVEPESQLETQLLSIWKKLLNSEQIGVTDNFYHVGGHSLLATQIISHLHQETNLHLDINEFFKHLTVRSCAHYLEYNQNTLQTIPNKKLDYYPLSHSQKRFLFLSELDIDKGQFNMPASILIHGNIDINRLDLALHKLSEKHAILKTIIVPYDNDTMQKISYNIKLSLDIFSENSFELPIEEFVSTWSRQPFHLYNTLLWRACLIHLKNNDSLFCICAHHLICDGYSIPILLRDLWGYYDSESDPDSTLSISYLDYAKWENEHPIEDEKYEFWHKELLACPYLQLPTDFPRLLRHPYEGNQLEWKLNGETWRALQIFCQQEMISIASYSIACFAIMLQRITHLNEFCIGIPFANRNHPELFNSVGCFINLIPLRISIQPDMTFREWVVELHAHIQKCLSFGSLPFSKLIERLAVKRTLNQSPLFNVVFNAQPHPFNSKYSTNLDLIIKPIHTNTSKYDLTLDIYFDEENLTGYCEYSSSLFKESTVNNWCDIYRQLLNQFTQQADSKLGDQYSSKLNIKYVLIDEVKKMHRPPVTDYDKKIAIHWSKSLGISLIGLDDNYFSLGGHSLLAARMMNSISKELMIDIPLETIFINPELEQFCCAVKQLKSTIPSTLPASKPNDSKSNVMLTPNQRQLALLYRENPSDAYHLGVLMECDSHLTIDKCKEIITTLINKHECYRWQLTEDFQFATIQPLVSIDIQKIVTSDIESTQEKASQFVSSIFDLQHAPLVRFSLITQNEQQQYFLISMHHIISDEWSLALLINTINQSFYQMNQDVESTMSWQDHLHRWLSPKTASLDYWRDYLVHQFSSSIPPTITNRKNKNYAKQYKGVLSSDIVKECRAISKKNGVSLYTVFLAIYFVWLKYHIAEDKLLIATTYDRRNLSSLHNLHGYLVNLIPVSVDFNQLETLQNIINYLNQDRINSIQHADVDFATLLEMNIINKPNIVFNFQHGFTIETDHLKSLKWQEVSGITAKFPLVFHLREQEVDEIECIIEYDSANYDEAFIENCFFSFKEILKFLPNNGDKNICHWQLCNKAYILSGHHDDSIIVNQNFISLLENIANIHSDKIAIEFNNSSLTYSELWIKVKRLAQAIYSYHGQTIENETIAVMMSNSDNYVITILAIMYLGASFLPIDTHYPHDRQQHMIKDSQSLFIITDETSLHSCSLLFSSLMQMNQPTFQLEASKNNYNAYLIYTSGTTGMPKGVQISQQQLLYFFYGLKTQFSVGQNDKILQFASISFDASIWEIFLSLFSGATLFIPTRKQRNVGFTLQECIEKNAITYTLLTPSVLKTLNSQCLTTLRIVVSGGESCTADLIDNWANKVEFYNAYGPTEATICTNIARMHDHTRANIIGHTLGQARLQVISDTLQPLPVGAVGELLISGPMVTAGYVNQAQLNQSKFITLQGERCYLSGDYVRILPGNQFEYLGRKDRQIKLRGLRIELSEIEKVILEYDLIEEVVCLISNEELIAYVVSNIFIETQSLLAAIANKLPHFMLPNHIIQIDAIPISSNGKLNQQALPTANQMQMVITLPRNETEQHLHAIWQQHLPISDFGINQDFFSLGGNSLHAMQIVASIENHYQINMPIHVFYSHSTIETQANFIQEQEHNSDNLLTLLTQLSDEELSELI